MGRWITLVLVSTGFVLLVSPYLAELSCLRRPPPTRPMAREAKLLQTFGQLCGQYAEEHDGNYPANGEELAKYLERSGSPYAERSESRSDLSIETIRERGFLYRPGLTLDSPPETVLAYLPPGRHEHGFLFFVSGQIRQVFERFESWASWESRLTGGVPAFEGP